MNFLQRGEFQNVEVAGRRCFRSKAVLAEFGGMQDLM